jgi:8-oxo-dGTP pyrophosphatase MutT (NUDIX family)
MKTERSNLQARALPLGSELESLTAERLALLLQDPCLLPRSTVAPSLSYGRHRGPASLSSRVAAVALTLFQDDQRQWMIPLTLRPRCLQHHGGQVCLPGGRVEPQEDLYNAALREFEEELGIEPRVIRRCGELSRQYVYASDNLVHPIVLVIEPPQQPWRPDPTEVEQVIVLPLAELLDRGCRGEMLREYQVRSGDQVLDTLAFRAAAFVHRGHKIWGATAMILDQLVQLLSQPVVSDGETA